MKAGRQFMIYFYKVSGDVIGALEGSLLVKEILG